MLSNLRKLYYTVAVQKLHTVVSPSSCCCCCGCCGCGCGYYYHYSTRLLGLQLEMLRATKCVHKLGALTCNNILHATACHRTDAVIFLKPRTLYLWARQRVVLCVFFSHFLSRNGDALTDEFQCKVVCFHPHQQVSWLRLHNGAPIVPRFCKVAVWAANRSSLGIRWPVR